MDVRLTLLDRMWPEIQAHLLPDEVRFERAAFIFASVEEAVSAINLQGVEWYPVPPEGFEEQSPYFLELTDDTKATVIKRAHDLEAALIEFHSHPFQDVAAFSLAISWGLLNSSPTSAGALIAALMRQLSWPPVRLTPLLGWAKATSRDQ